MGLLSDQSFDRLPTTSYEALLNDKVSHLRNLLQPIVDQQAIVDIVDKETMGTNITAHVATDVATNIAKTAVADMCVYPSPVSHFRMRAEFGIWHDNKDCYYTMVKKDEQGQGQRIKITTFPIASQAINELMPKLLEQIKASTVLKNKLFQVEFLSTLAGDMLVTLIYHKKLDEEWIAVAKQLETTLNCHIIGRSRKQKIVLTQDFVIEQLSVLDRTYQYQQVEGSFTQPNAQVCQSMLTWACQQAEYINSRFLLRKKEKSPPLVKGDLGGLAEQNNTDNAIASDLLGNDLLENDLLELYCGNGNFTLPLSQYFRKVLATEISKTSVASATYNIDRNAIDNIAIARLSAEEFTQAKNGEREFRRLQQADITLADYQFSTVFVDPPRAGIDDETLKLLSEFDFIIYVSCNPNTLVDNLQTLSKTHRVLNTALFDQFPYTDHIESGVLLEKR